MLDLRIFYITTEIALLLLLTHFMVFCFSLIFEKKFLCVTSDKTYSNRLIDLHNFLNCENNIHYNGTKIKT